MNHRKTQGGVGRERERETRAGCRGFINIRLSNIIIIASLHIQLTRRDTQQDTFMSRHRICIHNELIYFSRVYHLCNVIECIFKQYDNDIDYAYNAWGEQGISFLHFPARPPYIVHLSSVQISECIFQESE